MRRFYLFFITILAISPIASFATDWYVRPAGGNYGLENGTSYQNAWDGLEKVIWGGGGVQAGDNLYVCGLHIHTHLGGSVGKVIAPISGTSNLNRVVIRGDYPGDRGIIWGADRLAHESWINEGGDTYSITLHGNRGGFWYFQDVTPSSWIVLTKRFSLQDCRNNPGSFYSSNYAHGSKLYIHCSDSGDPSNRILAERFGYDFALDNTQYITFRNLETYGHYRMFINGLDNDVVHHIRFQNCKLWYGEHSIMHLRRNTSHIEFINCDIAWAMNGLDFSEGSLADGTYAPHHCLIQGCRIHDIGVVYKDSDAHCISWQGGYDNIIEHNECYNCGTGITFYLYDSQGMQNSIVRWNYIHDTHTYGGANGRGIEFNCESGNIQNRRGNVCYGNIAANINDAAFRSTFAGSNAEIKFCNNVSYNARIAYYFQQVGVSGLHIVLKNNISLNPIEKHIHFSSSGAPEGNYRVDSDFNCFFPISGQQFYFFVSTEGGPLALTGWRQLSKSGCSFDPNSQANDPQFANSGSSYQIADDFRLQYSSPLIDSGTTVGLNQDRDGVSIPQGFAPDIGPYEIVKSLYARSSASQTKGKIPLSVNFSAFVIGDFPPFSYSWNFGDGNTSNLQNASHTYTKTGKFSAILQVTDKMGNKELSSIQISAGSMYKFVISAATGSPSPGDGGTTSPSPGNHEIPSGSPILLSAIQNIGYRFSHWSGDVNPLNIYKNQFTLTLDREKSVTANFCTKGGDVNGDLQITPADAQVAFDIFLGRLSNPTPCQKENADVNCDGTKSNPKVTPSDAQAIFNKYLGKSDLPCGCSGNSRVNSLALHGMTASGTQLIISDMAVGHGYEISVPLIINSSRGIKAFGLDLAYPFDLMDFIRVEKSDFSNGFSRLDGYENSPGIIRLGGFGNQSEIPEGPISSILLVILVFRLKSPKVRGNPVSIQVINTFDDLINASIDNRIRQIDPSERSPGQKAKRELGIKKRVT